MTCDRYWRDGIVRVERGLDDPHRDGCADCTRAHASRQELVDALPLIGAGETGDPRWQANIWQRIDGTGRRARVPWWWQVSGALALACIVALWIGIGRHGEPGVGHPAAVVGPHPRPGIEIAGTPVAMRSGADARGGFTAVVDQDLRVLVDETSEVWIYRAERLVLRCRAREVSEHCVPDADGMVAKMILSIPGTYQVIVVETPVAPPGRGLDEARAALDSAGARKLEWTVLVH